MVIPILFNNATYQIRSPPFENLETGFLQESRFLRKKIYPFTATFFS
jgi:hypothetical protein